MFKGKRFLITQPMVHGLNGSTIVALELAEYLKDEGADVVVYTYYFDYPAKEFYDKNKVKVLVACDEPELKLEDFDYIWVHSQVVPISIIESMGSKISKDKMPIFIFNHMSPLDWIPDERPYIYKLEDSLSSLSCFVSKNTQEQLSDYFTKDYNKKFLFRNPAPISFSKLNKDKKDRVSSVLIVSSHPPEEVLIARNMLIEKDIKVTIFGEFGDEYSLITPDLLKKYDVVVTIGKTVQYCLTSGTPVYIYDRFGGCGYLNATNYQLASDWNFAGREECRRLSPEELVNELIDGYADASIFYTHKRRDFIELYSIDKIFPKLISVVKKRNIAQFDIQYKNSVISSQMFAKARFEIGSREIICRNGFNKIKKQLDATESDLAAERVKYCKLVSSESFRFGKFILTPIILLKKLAGRLKNLSNKRTPKYDFKKQ